MPTTLTTEIYTHILDDRLKRLSAWTTPRSRSPFNPASKGFNCAPSPLFILANTTPGELAERDGGQSPQMGANTCHT